jgi:hypothetical protein
MAGRPEALDAGSSGATAVDGETLRSNMTWNPDRRGEGAPTCDSGFLGDGARHE